VFEANDEAQQPYQLMDRPSPTHMESLDPEPRKIKLGKFQDRTRTLFWRKRPIPSKAKDFGQSRHIARLSFDIQLGSIINTGY
jgi:hypothetical protein